MHRTFFPPTLLLAMALTALLRGFAHAVPPPPAHLALTAAPLAGQVALTWNAAAGATSYSVKRATAANGTFGAVGSPTTTSFTDTTAAAGTRYFYRVTAIDGTGEGAVSLTISTTPAIVVDNAATSGVTITGAWSASTAVAGFYGTNYLLDGNTGGTGGKSVRFTPTLPFAGRYDAYLRWSSDASRATNVKVDVNSAAGTTFLKVNEQANGGTWVKLGAFDFAAGTGGNVLLRNDGANGWVVADAVQLVLNEQPLPGYTQVTFADEFDGTAYDAATWSVYDSRPNNFVSGGQLHLRTTWNGTDWVEGGLFTSQFMQRFGYFETVMQVARDDGLNNAFWLYTPFSHSNNVDKLEIDISEAHFHNENHMTVHDWEPVHVASGAVQSVPDIYPGYHTVGLEWTTDGVLRWYWDGALVRTMAASQLAGYENMTPMQVMFSTKVIPFAGTPGPLLDGSSMDIANVRAWMKPGWTGADSGNWGTPSNWGPDGVPGAGDAAVFNGATARTTVSIAGDKSVKELYFSAPECPAMTFAAGSFKFLLGALASGSGGGGIVVNGDVTTAQTINTAIQAQNDLTFANYSTAPTAALNINSVLTSSATGRQLTLAGNGRVNVGSVIGPSFGNVVKVNGGALKLGTANSFTGTLDVQAGSVIVTSDGALGATGTAARTMLSATSSLVLSGNLNYSTAEELHINSTGDAAAGRLGSLDTEGGTAFTFAGPIVCDTHSTIANSVAGSLLTLTGAIDTATASYKLTFEATGDIVATNVISGAGRVKVSGPGAVTLGTNNTYIGPTDAYPEMAVYPGGTLIVQGDGAFGAQPAAFKPLNVENKGTMRIVNSFALHPNRGVSLGLAADFGEGIFEISPGVTFEIPGVIANIGGQGDALTKTGAGTLVFTGANTYTGPTTIRAGLLRITANERISNSSPLTVDGGTFDLNGFTETVGPVTLSSGSIANSTGTSAQYLAGSAYDLRSGTVSARLGGSGAFTKTTGGTVTLSGANTFTGGTTVQAGTLDLAGSLASSVSIDGGALALGSTTGARTVNGSLTVNAGGNLRVRINGTTAGTQYDQLRLTNAASTVTLAGTLDLIAASGLTAGSTFRIIDNSGSSTTAITGTFTGLPEGAEFYEDGQWWRISYTGGTGNDVVLTRITPTPTQTWQSTNFGTDANNPLIAGDLADPDYDGIRNLLERATAMNPNGSDPVPMSVTKTATTLDFIYTKNKSATDLTYTVEWSDALANDWSTTGLSAPAILSDNGTTQQIKVAVPAGSEVAQRFVHLKVTRP